MSETRKFYTADHLTPDVIAADSVYTALDPDGLLFALVSSSIFITWQRTVGGALESRLLFQYLDLEQFPRAAT
nr:type IIL restriction-modification enzyme MmeI [Corynebacterium mucifaciens]